MKRNHKFESPLPLPLLGHVKKEEKKVATPHITKKKKDRVFLYSGLMIDGSFGNLCKIFDDIVGM
jgi:hypothetical protein